jgi:hypothetical protein
MEDIKLVIEGDYISFMRGNNEVYGVDLDRCRDSAEFLDWILQLHGKTWVTPKLIHDFIETMNMLCRERLGGSAQGCFCPWGSNRKVDWKSYWKNGAKPSELSKIWNLF